MKKLLAKIRKILRDRRTRRFLTRFVSGVAALIVFVTTYALVLPAITMEKEANCGIEAHQHDDSCYTEELICDIPESDGHHHDESCYSTTSALVCETEEHEHSAENGCYDDEGNLICEVMEHRHNEECYEEVRELTCQIPESEGHHHTEDCYEKVLTCGKEVHVHSTACYENDPVSESAIAASTSSAAASTTSAGSVSSAGMTLNFEGDIEKIIDTDEPVDDDSVDNIGSDETNGSSETNGTSEIASSDKTNTEAVSDTEVTYGRENAGTGHTETSNTALTNSDNSTTALTSSADADQYIPQLDAVDFNTVLNNHTGIYYYRAADEDIVEDSSAIPAEDWNRIPNNIDRINDDMDDVELGSKDLLRVYLSYTIPAGSLNATNPVARYRLPSNIHLTDPQVKAINENVNGLAGQYVDMSTLEITDPDKYNAYLGVEAVEGTRRPDEAVEDYLAEQARKAGKDTDDATEYISAVVRVENVYDADGLYGEKDAYLGQDLIFTFAPYSIEKNQHEYDSTGKPTRAGEEIKGWFTFDLNMGQVDFEEPEITTSTAEETSDIEDNVDGDSESRHSEDENTEENHAENVQTEDDHNGDDLIKEDSIEDGHKDESNEENHSANNTTVDVNTADNESSEDGKADDNQDRVVTIERAERTAEIIFVEEEWDGKDKKIDQVSTTLTVVEETVLEAQNDDKLEDNEDPSVSGEKERSAEENEGALSDEATADGNVKDPVDTEQVIMPAMSFNDSIKVSTGKPVGIDENAGSFLANAAESLPEEAEVSVRVEADEGTFPAGTTMVLSAVDQSSYDTLAETLAETVERRETSDTDISDTDTSEAKANTQQAETDNAEDQEIKQNTEQNNADNNTNIKTYGFQAVDITFFDKDGNEIEPAKPVRVALTSTVVKQAREKAEESAIADPVVVHVDNEGKAEQMDLVSPEEVEPAKGRSEEEMLEEAEKTAESGKTDNADNDISADDASDKKDVEHKADAVDESASAVSRDIDEAEESVTEGITVQEDTTAVEENGESADTAEFTADSFSLYAIVYTVELYTNVITDSGETYRISVTYDETSGIPQDAELKVKEIKKGDKGYEDYYTEAVKAASESSDAQNDASNNNASDKDNKRVNPDKTYARFFDIEIWANGEKIEPTGDVSVSIRLLDVPETDDENVIKIVHFAQDDIEVIPHTTAADHVESVDTAKDQDDEQAENNVHSEMEFNFTASSFSVYSVVSYTVDFHWEVNGKMYEFSIPGGGFVSLEHVVEVLGIARNGENSGSEAENQAYEAENTADSDAYNRVEESGVDENGANTGSSYEESVNLNNVDVSEATKKFVTDVANVEFSSPELVWVGKADEATTVGGLKEANGLEVQYSAELTEEQITEINSSTVEAGDWALISMQPFLSNESLMVTMKDGETFIIRVTDGQIKKTVISASGETYEVIVTYGEEAQIPDSAELRVKEILKEDEAYSNLQKKAGEELSEQLENAIPSHPVLFDIAIYDGDTEIEPAEGNSVQVEIRLLKGSVTGTYTDPLSPLLINDEPVNADEQEIIQKLQIIHDVKGGLLEAVDVKETATEEKVIGQFETTSFSNWLLFLDEDLTDITVYKGDSITLRPYGEWYWKRNGEPAEIQALSWTFPDTEYNVTWGWRNNIPIDYNGNTRNYYGITQAKTWDGKYTINGYAKYDRELHEEYWYYHVPNLQPGDFTLHVGDTRTIRVHVIDEAGHADDKPGTVTGVNSIAVNLFDYDKGGVLDEGWNWNHTANNQNLATSAFNNTINIGHDLKFLSSGSAGIATGNNHGYNGYYSENVHPGIVKTYLTSEGYPELAYGTDLKYLFDTSKTSWVDGDKMIAYPNVTGLFQQDARGYYYFNSNINYAYYNPANGNKQVTLYEHTYTQSTTGTLDATGVGENAKPIGFFPFHDYDSTHNLNVNQNSNLNHHLGMSMNLQFDIPQDKQINGEDILFEFSGDDDLWVFVDGKLVLDMGGIHQPVPGTINFSETSNNVNVYGQNQKSVTFTPGYHTMEVFYLERGGCDSNCSIMFNMPLVIGRGDFKVVKKGEKETENKNLQGAVFGLWETEECIGNPVRQATSGNNGLVEFNNLSVKNPGQVYYMKEISAPNGYIRSKKIYTVTASNNPGSDGKYTFTIREKDNLTPLDTITQEPYTPIVYNLKQKPRNISLHKTWQNEYGEIINAPSGATATFKLHKKGNYSVTSEQERTLYKIQLQNLSGSTLAQGFFYEGDKIRLKYEFDNSPIHTTMSKNNIYYADLIKENGDTGPRYVNYTVSASDADTNNQIVFKRENDANGNSHGFKTKEWELVEAAPIPSVSTENMEDRIIETFSLPHQGQWSRTFNNLDTYDAEGNPFIYWFEETGINNAAGYFPVTVTNADNPLEVDQSMQEIKNIKKAAIKIVKVTKGTETGIPGAKFTLTQVDEEGHPLPEGIVKPEVTTDEYGIIIFDNLEPGRYELAETKVPDGYIKNEGPYFIIVNTDYTTSLDTSVAHTLITKSETSSVYTVQNEPGSALPNTGGPGTRLYTILGTILILGAGVLLCRRRRLI